MQLSGFAFPILLQFEVQDSFNALQLPEALTRAAAAIEAQGFAPGARPRRP